MTPRAIQRVYLGLLLLSTSAASLIWGVNTLFLLDAGLSNAQAFAANAFFSAGQVLFEVPTGVVADRWGRRASYLLGALTLCAATLLYLLAWRTRAPFIWWAGSSVLLGLGFTFFSGATEAWLVDALAWAGFTGTLESVFAKGQIVGGAAMLAGSAAGGLIAQATNLGVPYVLRAAILALTFVAAFIFMKDLGFVPRRGAGPLADAKALLSESVAAGWRDLDVRWVMLETIFSSGVAFYVFYALQPHLLKLYGRPEAYGVAGIAAACVAGAQIAGGFAVPYIRRAFRRRSSLLAASLLANAALLVLIAKTSSFPAAVLLLVAWGLLSAARMPVRQAYLNAVIPSSRRATMLSLDSLVASSGAVVVQPALGRTADLWGYPASFAAGAGVSLLGLPLLLLARARRAPADEIA